MKKTIVTLASLVLLVGGLGFLFRAPLIEFAKAKVTEDMFVADDGDGFDPGLKQGERFPPIRALYQGKTVTSIDPFILDKGMIFIANRSVDW
ncbi:MAG: hypothetical protein AAGA91_07995 [Pseudomonadota bacterium]